MAVIVKSKKGKDVILLNPSEKGRKFATELKYSIHLTNDYETKLNKNGKYKMLSDTQKAFRSGYLAAQKDCSKCYNAKKYGR